MAPRAVRTEQIQQRPSPRALRRRENPFVLSEAEEGEEEAEWDSDYASRRARTCRGARVRACDTSPTGDRSHSSSDTSPSSSDTDDSFLVGDDCYE